MVQHASNTAQTCRGVVGSQLTVMVWLFEASLFCCEERAADAPADHLLTWQARLASDGLDNNVEP